MTLNTKVYIDILEEDFDDEDERNLWSIEIRISGDINSNIYIEEPYVFSKSEWKDFLYNNKTLYFIENKISLSKVDGLQIVLSNSGKGTEISGKINIPYHLINDKFEQVINIAINKNLFFHRE